MSQEVEAGEPATVEQDGGARIEVPQGATAEPTTVPITEVPAPPSDLQVGRVFDFSAGDVELTAPVILHIPYNPPVGQPTARLYAVHWDEDAGD